MEFALQRRGSYEQVRAAAQWAESNELAVFALPDHYLAGRDSGGKGHDTRSADIYPYLGGLAIDTERIGLAALVSPVSYRHPATLLKMGLALDEMSGGRFTLGVGAGWMKAEHAMFGFPLPDWSERFDRLEEALEYLAAALGEGAAGFTGRYYRLGQVDHQPKPAALRIMVGGSGPRRTPELAGRFADEYNIYSLPSPAIERRIAVAREAAAAAGRDPGALLCSCTAPPVIGPDPATFRARMLAFAASRGVDPGRIEREFREIGVPMGTHEEARDTVGRIAGTGVGRFYLQVLGSFDLDYAAEVLEVLA